MKRIGNAFGLIVAGLLLWSCNTQSLEVAWETDIPCDGAILAEADNLILRLIYNPFPSSTTNALLKCGADGQLCWVIDTAMYKVAFVGDPEGNVYASGNIEVDGNYHIGLAKYSSTGASLWNVLDPDVYSSTVWTTIILDKDRNCIVVQHYCRPYTMAKYTRDGELLWKQSIPQYPNKLAANDSGDIYVISDLELFKFGGATGELLWERTHQDISLNSLVIDREGDVVIAGDAIKGANNPLVNNTMLTMIKYAPDGTLLWKKDCDVIGLGLWQQSETKQIATDNERNLIVARACYIITFGVPYPGITNPDLWFFQTYGYRYAELLKFDQDGNLLWTHNGDAGSSDNIQLAVDQANGITWCVEATFFHYNPDGAPVWEQQTPGAGKLLVDSSGLPYWIGGGRVIKYKYKASQAD